MWLHSVPRGQIVAIRGCVGWGLLDPLGVRPGSGPTVRGCLLQGLPCSSSKRSKLLVNSGVPQNRGVPAGRDTYTDPVPTADSWGTPSSAPCPQPRVPRHPLPWQQEMAPAQPRPGRTRRGQRLTGGRQPRLSGVLGPGNFPRLAGLWILAKPHPEPLPAFRRGGAFAGGLCPRSFGEPARPAGAPVGRAKGPQPAVGTAAASRTGIVGWHQLCPTH